jgi:hypothetical protein
LLKTALVIAGVLLSTRLVDAAETSTLDLRQRANPTQQEITIWAENHSSDDYGHAFVGFSQEDDKRLMTTLEVFGFYPPDGQKDNAKLLKAFFGAEVPGELRNDFFEIERAGHKVIIKVDDDQFARGREVVRLWKAAHPTYIAAVEDCTTLVGEVASAIGLDVPYRITKLFPDDYVQKIVQIAKKTEIEEHREVDRIRNERIQDTYSRNFNPTVDPKSYFEQKQKQLGPGPTGPGPIPPPRPPFKGFVEPAQ